jgi:hypothetical protein
MTLTSAYRDICRALAAAWLSARGGFEFQVADSVPPLTDGRPARTVLLAGNAGPGMWEAFSRAEHHQPNPLDRWSRAILETIAARHNGGVVMPSDGYPHPPEMGFMAWISRCTYFCRSAASTAARDSGESLRKLRRTSLSYRLPSRGVHRIAVPR